MNFRLILFLIIFPLITYAELVYPVIFIHGLNSNNETWDPFKTYLENNHDLLNGGTMNFCLNSDGDLKIAGFENDYIDFQAENQNNLKKGDFYFINFDVDYYGLSPAISLVNVLGNQQAIYKQGRAVRDAIKHVLKVSGKDKVVLIGHSMGGLAAREYLSNSNIWQTDGNHHVAKLFTTGTPHGGTNSTILGAGALLGLDETADATRDLKYSYIFGGKGVYLFGGIESHDNISNNLFFNCHSVDVNCNDSIGENIVGLNEKSIPTDIYYTCAIGTNYVSGGDGLVSDYRANMNNYMSYSVPFSFKADTFLVNNVHTKLTSLKELNTKGMDEPDEYHLAYKIETEVVYTGMVSRPSGINVSGTEKDYDDFTFDLEDDIDLRVQISQENGAYTYQILNEELDLVFENQPTKTLSDTTINLSSGKYYLEVISDADGEWEKPYSFILTDNSKLVTSLQEQIGIIEEYKDSKKELVVYPNPSSDVINITYIGTNSCAIYNASGQLINRFNFTNNTSIDISEIERGSYLLEISNPEGITSSKFIKK